MHFKNSILASLNMELKFYNSLVLQRTITAEENKEEWTHIVVEISFGEWNTGRKWHLVNHMQRREESSLKMKDHWSRIHNQGEKGSTWPAQLCKTHTLKKNKNKKRLSMKMVFFFAQPFSYYSSKSNKYHVSFVHALLSVPVWSFLEHEADGQPPGSKWCWAMRCRHQSMVSIAVTLCTGRC